MVLTKKELIVLLTLAGVNFTHIVDFMVLMPLEPKISLEFNLSPFLWSVVVSLYSFSAFFSGILSMFFIDKISRKKMLHYTYFGFILGTFACGFCESFSQLTAARAFTGFFGGIISSVILAIVGDYIAYEKRGRAMGIIMMGFSSAAALGVPIGIYFSMLHSWRFPFLVLAILSSGLFVLSFLVVPVIEAKDSVRTFTIGVEIKRITSIIANRTLFLTLLFYCVLIFSQFLMIPFLTPFLVKNVGFTDMQLVYMYVLGGCATIITGPFIGKLSDKYGFKKTLIAIVMLSLIPIFFISKLSGGMFVYAYFFSLLFFVFVSGRIIPAMAILVSRIKDQKRGLYMSFRSSGQQLFSGLAAFVSGLIIVESNTGALEHYSSLSILAILSSIFSLLLLSLSEG